MICENYLTVSIDANFITRALRQKSYFIDSTSEKTQKKVLKYMSWLNWLIALAFATMMTIGFANSSDPKPWVFKLFTFSAIMSGVYLLIWIGALVFLYLKIRKMTNFLPKKKMFVLHGLFICLANITSYGSIILFAFINSCTNSTCIDRLGAAGDLLGLASTILT